MKKKIDLLSEQSEYSKEILEKTPSWIISWGNSVFFIIIFILLLLTWVIKYPDIVVSEVEITSQNPPINIVSRTSGKLKELYFSDGQFIKKGQWIAVIENSANTEDMKEIDSLLNLPFEELIVKIPEKLELGESQLYFNNLIKFISQYKFYKTYNPQLVGISSNKERINKVNNIQSDYNYQKEIAKKEYEFKKGDYLRYSELFEKGVISKSDFEKMQIELLQTENRYKSFSTNISNLESDKSLIKKDNAELILEKENQNIDYVTNISTAVQELKSQILNWKNKYLFEAPADGNINFFEVWKINQFVKNEQVLFTLVQSEKGSYFARGKMATVGSGKVKKGQKVIIKLANYPSEEYGYLQGKINKITTVTNSNYYFINISLDNGLITNQNKKIKPNNLVGQAEIITADLKLIERFVYILTKDLKQ
ncbi:HlyD family secretion protein [Flavobacterium humidisoli]|uniref:HlyD family secretion protein n=1 Tax=Flavobacterium humidisoli TaxID=2937442 RepID=A0ABY4LTL4_9FLAO|nr:HlyD family efflux transporter periplasmic adaptor subunit [Flavobacterium humidisoli]UPZ16415.1 HlyD family secretion protein [Flavobacterium humidisoli]